MSFLLDSSVLIICLHNPKFSPSDGGLRWIQDSMIRSPIEVLESLFPFPSRRLLIWDSTTNSLIFSLYLLADFLFFFLSSLLLFFLFLLKSWYRGLTFEKIFLSTLLSIIDCSVNFSLVSSSMTLKSEVNVPQV